MSKSQSSSLWWPEHCKDESKMNLHQQQADVYHILKGLLLFYSQYNIIVFVFYNLRFSICSGIYSTGELPSGSVLGLTVDDPRLTLPRKKVKALPSVQQAQGKI